MNESHAELSEDRETQILANWGLVREGLSLETIADERRHLERRKIDRMFPDAGPFRRALYPKHLQHFASGAAHRERLFIAGNRCGKTTAGAYEVALHLTGEYPGWWEGRRFQCAIDAWVAGETAPTTRDIVQLELLGKWNAIGTGMIPGEHILTYTLKGRPAHAVDTVTVRHASGGTSTLGFKAYREGASAFQGTAKHLIWNDEEPDLATYVEQTMRTMIVPGCAEGGIVLVTFTPLDGWSDVVESFMGEPQRAGA